MCAALRPRPRRTVQAAATVQIKLPCRRHTCTSTLQRSSTHRTPQRVAHTWLRPTCRPFPLCMSRTGASCLDGCATREAQSPPDLESRRPHSLEQQTAGCGYLTSSTAGGERRFSALLPMARPCWPGYGKEAWDRLAPCRTPYAALYLSAEQCARLQCARLQCALRMVTSRREVLIPGACEVNIASHLHTCLQARHQISES